MSADDSEARSASGGRNSSNSGDGDGAVGVDDLPDDEFADLPDTDIDVEAHVHFGMTGSFPLRLAELFFADDGLHVVEYSYITPMFGLGTRKHKREAESMQRVYEYHGLDEVLMQGDSIVWLNYDALDRVVVYDGGWLGRPKIDVRGADGRSWAYRLHDDADADETVAELRPCAEQREFAVERRAGVGYDPRASVRRFLR